MEARLVSAAAACASASALAPAPCAPAVASAPVLALAPCALGPAPAAAPCVPAPAVAAPAAAVSHVSALPRVGTVHALVVNAPASSAAGQSGTTALQPIEANFIVFHLNINNLDVRLDLLDTLLSLHNFLEFVAITETHLAKSVEVLRLSKYELVSRRDRSDRQGGGIALYARWDVHPQIVHTCDSATLELSWHTLHSDAGPLLLGVWYRPPRRGDVASISAFDAELKKFDEDFIGRIIVGDMNVHNKDWLQFSSGISPEGLELENVCAAHGLKQFVKEATRGEYLLDLVLSDLGSCLQSSVHNGILEKDHRCVLCQVNISISASHVPSRTIFDFGKAKWTEFKEFLKNFDWSTFMFQADPDRAAFDFTEFLSFHAKRFIPVKVVKGKPYKHPWIDETCRRLLREKHDSVGTPSFIAARDRCTAGFREAQSRFFVSTKHKLQNSNGKDWWKLSKDLLAKNTGKENIPPLKVAGGWIKEPDAKATSLSATFATKSCLPDPQANEFSHVHPPSATLHKFLRIRRRDVLKILKALDVSSATGPDGLPAFLLHKCSEELALPIALLSRACLQSGRWPACWRFHWIHPLHKKKSKADPENYRGIHLTPQLAKVVERAVGQSFVPWLGAHAFGEHQYAYSAGKSHRDALAVNVCSWLLLMEEGRAIGLYCSDVSGAFDRVDRERLSLKLRSCGLPSQAVAFLESWLEDRESSVIIAGARSENRPLENSVFQGTVLGPPLWNVFYADARFSVRELGFVETVFADDFNCWLSLPKNTSWEHAEARLTECQSNLHRWGAANRVVFDPGKEEFILLRRRDAIGNDFRLLGVVFDPQLLMKRGAKKIATEAGWRLKAILKARRLFSTPELMRLYKAHVLSYIESGTPRYYHASPSCLDCIDRVQRRFLREISVSEERALLDYRLAPLQTRRSISILGFLHRITLGQVSTQFANLFPKAREIVVPDNISSRVRGERHNRQLLDRVSAYSTDVLRRNIFGTVQCYNALPQNVVEKPSVSSFQRALQAALSHQAELKSSNWQGMFSDGRRYSSALRFQSLFRHL